MYHLTVARDDLGAAAVRCDAVKARAAQHAVLQLALRAGPQAHACMQPLRHRALLHPSGHRQRNRSRSRAPRTAACHMKTSPKQMEYDSGVLPGKIARFDRGTNHHEQRGAVVDGEHAGIAALGDLASLQLGVAAGVHPEATALAAAHRHVARQQLAARARTAALHSTRSTSLT